MDFLKHIFGGESKNDFSERIPDLLTPNQFGVHPTFHHGFLAHPSCLAFDCIQNVLAIGSYQGNISIIGKPALEKHFTQPGQTPVLQLLFVVNKGHLITRCNDNAVYLWNIQSKIPYIEHKLEFQKDVPCLLALAYMSNWLYVGMEGGNVHLIQVSDFQVSGYTIYWDKVTAHEAGHRSRPGDVIGMQEHPLDPSKLLLAFSGGLCVLWNVKTKMVEKQFKLSNKSIAILLGIDWNSNGKQFAGGYSDGSIGIYNIKNEGKPEKIVYPHGAAASSSPILRFQWVNCEGAEPIFVFSGGFPDGSSIGVKSLTFYNSKSTNLLNFENSIIDFICLPSSPFVTDTQRLFAAVVLTESELIVHDLQTQGFPVFNVPYSFDINFSPVTAIGYHGNCPDDFVAELQSVLTKLPQELKSTKRWPLSGGKWGQEVPDPWTDLIITGHANGTVRLWYCRSVIMQPLLTIDSSNYLKPVTSTSKVHAKTTTPTKRTTPTKQATSPPSRASTLPTFQTTPSKRVPSVPNAQTTPTIQTSRRTTTPIIQTTPTHQTTTPLQRVPSVPNGQTTPTDQATTPPHRVPTDQTTSVETTPTDVSPKHTKQKSSKMFGLKKMKRPSLVKFSNNKEEGKDKETPPPLPLINNEEVEPIIVKQNRPTNLLPPDEPPLLSSPSLLSPATGSAVTTGRESNDGDYMILSLTSDTTRGNNNNGCCVHTVTMEPHSQILCIGTKGGHALCLDFSLKPMDRPAQSLQINYANDSVIKPDEEDNVGVANLVSHAHPNYQFDYTFNNDIDKTLPGFHVFQHCFGYYGNSKDISGIHITDIRYNAHRKLLVIGTDCGLSIIDANQNLILKSLTHLESILYISDPSSYSRQCRKIIEDSFHSSSSSPSVEQEKFDRQYTDQLMSPLTSCTEQRDFSFNSTKIISDSESHTSERLVTKIEIVQMFVSKSGESSLTLWVGTKCGKVCVYIIKTTKQLKTDILPTGIIIDMKSFLVEMMFLSEWGERLINPYMGNRDSNKSSPAIVAINRRRSISSKTAAGSEKSVNYVIITVRDRIKSIGFPSNNGIAEVKPNLSNEGFIVDSEFMVCDGLPCIASWTSNGLILIHLLPGLKPMLHVNHTPLLDYRALNSFKVACDGQGIYLATPTQIQRVSLIKTNQLNFPESLPDIHCSNRDDPQPTSKGLFHALFKQGSTVDRSELFGIETAGKAWRSVAKRDDSLQKRGASSGASNAFEQAREKLDQRGKDLSQLEEKTEQLQDDATDFANVAHLLAEKHKRKRLF